MCENDQRIILSASEKNSVPPKLPDFSASNISPFPAPTARKTGTPAAISAPTSNPAIPSDRRQRLKFHHPRRSTGAHPSAPDVGDIGHRLLDGMPGCIAAMTGSQSCDLL
jgi:hypothetical protein